MSGARVKSDIRREFIELAIQFGALRFGEFTLKSGRISPYFFNAGVFSTGRAMSTLGRCYAAIIADEFSSADGLFGPAYKGIPLATSTAIALLNDYERDLPVTFDRKEVKTHGEGGQLMGASLSGNIVSIDDVITAGTAIRHSVDLIQAHGATAAGVVIGLDRCERGTGQRSAVEEAEQSLGLAVRSVITLHDIIDWLETQQDSAESLAKMREYREEFGV
ncbi:MAG: orotate phosphoribosyltransferase [Halieaceae bacterium MED-G27]|nr:orotate phosphoribosyltransferase [Halieaceae bacterium]OUT64984.1 MAG: orotate phosphoribosyltransferase [Cellvibrionales bacterium TMED21]PDH36627.1 MAG: orotate phosphoribosyltransferase [Halieaceae bacterium MED-G27]